MFVDPIDPDAEMDEDEAEDIIDTLEADFEIGESIKEQIIPRAVLYFTGEALHDTDFESITDDDEDEEVGREQILFILLYQY